MKLFYAPTSPFARKVRAAAIELGLAEQIELELTEVAPGRKNEAFANSVSPLRKIPALVLKDGVVVVDSTVICEYLDACTGGGRLFPASGEARWRVLTRHSVAQGMCEAVVLVRYETSLRPAALRWDNWVDDQWDKIWSGLRWFEKDPASLTKPRNPNIADLALACCLGYIDLRFPDANWRDRFPSVGAWCDSLMKRPSLAETSPKAPPRP